MLSLPLTRRLLTRQREAQIKGYFHRHGFKILVSGRFVPGFRTAAYLTAGILKLPPVKLVLTDVVAASLSTMFLFGLGYAFAYQIQKEFAKFSSGSLVGVAVAVVVWLLIRYYRGRRSGQPVGPPVLEDDLDPLSIDRSAGLSQLTNRLDENRSRNGSTQQEARGSRDTRPGGGRGGTRISRRQVRGLAIQAAAHLPGVVLGARDHDGVAVESSDAAAYHGRSPGASN